MVWGSKGIRWWDWKKKTGEDQGRDEDLEWSASGTEQEVTAKINIYIFFLSNGSRALVELAAGYLINTAIHCCWYLRLPTPFQPAVIDAEQWLPWIGNKEGPALSNSSYSKTLAALIKRIKPYDLAHRAPRLMQDFLDGGGSYWRSCPSPAGS